jgi:hypothetical protein
VHSIAIVLLVCILLATLTAGVLIRPYVVRTLAGYLQLLLLVPARRLGTLGTAQVHVSVLQSMLFRIVPPA